MDQIYLMIDGLLYIGYIGYLIKPTVTFSVDTGSLYLLSCILSMIYAAHFGI